MADSAMVERHNQIETMAKAIASVSMIHGDDPAEVDRLWRHSFTPRNRNAMRDCARAALAAIDQLPPETREI